MWKLLVLLLCISSTAFGQQDIVDFDLTPGPYEVGFRVETLRDSTRSFQSEEHSVKRRVVQAAIWYPAETYARGDSMWFYDYIRHCYHWHQIIRGNPWVGRQGFQTAEAFQSDFGISAEQYETLKRTKTNCFINATPHQGPFPTIFYSPGANGSPLDNSPLLEFFASHGYVVISYPSVGHNQRLMQIDTVGLDAQYQDLLMTYNYAKSLPYTDNSNMAAMGHSWGGVTSAMLAQNHQTVKCAFSMDGSEKYHFDKLKEYSHLDPKKMNKPYFYARSYLLDDQIRKAKFDTSFHYIKNLMTTRKAEYQFHYLAHTDFASLLHLLPDAVVKERVAKPEYIRQNYLHLCAYAFHFMEYHLKGTSDSRYFLHNRPRSNRMEGYVTRGHRSGNW